MPTSLSHYILTRQNESFVQVDVYDPTVFASYQVYVDLALAVEATAISFTAPVKKNQKVDLLGLALGEVGQDFSHTLSDANGDKIEFDLPTEFDGAKVRVYGDGGTGVIDFGTVI